MTNKRLEYAAISEVGALIRTNALSSVELTTLMLDRIERLDDRLNAFITVTSDLALAQAQQADSELRSGNDRGPLHGVPIAIKDLIATSGILTTAGSKYYENWVPDTDATVVRMLRDSGAVLLGKTGLHEHAFGSTSVNPFYGAISNPWRLDYHPGGSSGGSAVAVAAGMAYAAIGTDTGCSVRQPAHCCGIVGHKPSYGLVSKAGVLPLVASMDHVGPLTRSVADAELVLAAIQGADPDDPQSVESPRDTQPLRLSSLVDGAVVGVPRRFFFDGGDATVINVVEQALLVFEGLGAQVVNRDIPNIEQALREADVTFREIADACGEALSDDPEAFSPPFRKRFEGVTRHSDDRYAAAQEFRRAFRVQVDEVLTRCDILAMPTSTVTAAAIAHEPPGHPVERRKNCCIFNFTGHPAISVPCGFSDNGLPVGLMLVGKLFDDDAVFRFARAFEAATPWHSRHPKID